MILVPHILIILKSDVVVVFFDELKPNDYDIYDRVFVHETKTKLSDWLNSIVKLKDAVK